MKVLATVASSFVFWSPFLPVVLDRSSIASDIRSWVNRQKGKNAERSFDPTATILGEEAATAQSKGSGADKSASSPGALRGSGEDDCATAHFYEPPGDDTVPRNSLAADLGAWFRGDRKHPPFLEQFAKVPRAQGSTQGRNWGFARGDRGNNAAMPLVAVCPACGLANPAEGSTCELCEARALSTRCSHCGETMPFFEAENHFCAAAAEGSGFLHSHGDNNEAAGGSNSNGNSSKSDDATSCIVSETNTNEGTAGGGGRSGDGDGGGAAAAQINHSDESAASGGGSGGVALEEFPRLAGEGVTEPPFPGSAMVGEAAENDAATADKFLFWGLPAEGGEEHQSLIDRIKASWATSNRPGTRVKPFDRGALPEPAAAAAAGAASAAAADGGGGNGLGSGARVDNRSSPEVRMPPGGLMRASSSRGNLLDFEKAEGGCIICCCDRPAYPACYVPCGHASMCYGCALDSAISLSGTCPLCRTKASAIVTYEPLELLQLPKSELAGLQATRRGAGGAIVLPRKDESKAATAESTPSTKSGDSSECVLCWVARVVGPTGALLDSLTVEDLARTEDH